MSMTSRIGSTSSARHQRRYGRLPSADGWSPLSGTVSGVTRSRGCGSSMGLRGVCMGGGTATIVRRGIASWRQSFGSCVPRGGGVPSEGQASGVGDSRIVWATKPVRQHRGARFSEPAIFIVHRQGGSLTGYGGRGVNGTPHGGGGIDVWGVCSTATDI